MKCKSFDHVVLTVSSPVNASISSKRQNMKQMKFALPHSGTHVLLASLRRRVATSNGAFNYHLSRSSINRRNKRREVVRCMKNGSTSKTTKTLLRTNSMVLDQRISCVKRVTKETNVQVEINLDGTGICSAKTPIPFLNHMLDVCNGVVFCDFVFSNWRPMDCLM